jgi:FkbM family methyltransferase
MFWKLIQYARREHLLRHPIRGARGIWLRVRWWVHWHWHSEQKLLYPFYGGMTIQLAKSSASLGIGLNRGFTDRGCANPFLKFRRPGMVAADCGAHIGEYTLLFASSVGPTGQVRSFEPHAGVFEVLRENVQHNDLRQVVINHAAIGRQSGAVRFHPAIAPTASSILTTDTADVSSVEVSLVSLDDSVRQRGLTGVDAIKIDVEGAEWDVIEGAEQVLARRD